MRIFKYAGGAVWRCDNFAAIGSGSIIAEATLMQRGHSELWQLNRTIYAVYEAHKLGSIAPGVGAEMRMNIGAYDPNLNGVALAIQVDPDWRDAMEKAYAEFGPKEIDLKLALPEKLFFGL